MRILFIRLGLYYPELYAGTELTLHWLCRALLDGGHEVVVATNSSNAASGTVIVDRVCGYRVYRGNNLNDSVQHALADFQPDVFVAPESGPWLTLLPENIRNSPLVLYEHQVSLYANEIPDELKAHCVYIANSAATAAHLSENCGVASTIVRPLFGIEQYAGLQRHGRSVLFVSTQLRKGADLATRIAQSRPREKFVFIESWTETPERMESIREHLGRIANVTLMPNQPGLGHIFPDIKLLLMPSRSQEAWGRTATEAQICGIPVLGSSRGNLPVTIGPGGMTLDPDEPLERWLDAFDRIMNDPILYEDLSRKAREHGSKFLPEVARAYDTFVEALEDAVSRQRA